MNVSVSPLHSLPPVNFDAWKKTCLDLADALAAGVHLVALVGPQGSGKTSTLTAFAFAPAIPTRRASLRSPTQPLDPEVSLDLVDNVDEQGLESLAAAPVFEGRRVVALRPQAQQALLRYFPDAKIVTVQPMTSRDVRAFVEARRKQLGLPADVFTLRALSSLEKICGGYPGRLDDLCASAADSARIANAHRISAEHVEMAERVRLIAQPWQSKESYHLRDEAVINPPFANDHAADDHTASRSLVEVGKPLVEAGSNLLSAANETVAERDQPALDKPVVDNPETEMPVFGKLAVVNSELAEAEPVKAEVIQLRPFGLEKPRTELVKPETIEPDINAAPDEKAERPVFGKLGVNRVAANAPVEPLPWEALIRDAAAKIEPDEKRPSRFGLKTAALGAVAALVVAGVVAEIRLNIFGHFNPAPMWAHSMRPADVVQSVEKTGAVNPVVDTHKPPVTTAPPLATAAVQQQTPPTVTLNPSSPAIATKASEDPADAGRLLAMGKKLQASGDNDAATRMFNTAARLGNLEAAALVVKDALNRSKTQAQASPH